MCVEAREPERACVSEKGGRVGTRTLKGHESEEDWVEAASLEDRGGKGMTGLSAKSC